MCMLVNIAFRNSPHWPTFTIQLRKGTIHVSTVCTHSLATMQDKLGISDSWMMTAAMKRPFRIML